MAENEGGGCNSFSLWNIVDSIRIWQLLLSEIVEMKGMVQVTHQSKYDLLLLMLMCVAIRNIFNSDCLFLSQETSNCRFSKIIAALGILTTIVSLQNQNRRQLFATPNG